MKTLTNLTYLKIKSLINILVSKYKGWDFEAKVLFWAIMFILAFIFISNIPFYKVKQNVYYYGSRKEYNIETKVLHYTSWYNTHRVYDHDLNIKDIDKLIDACQKERTIAEDFKKAHKKVK